VDEPGPREVRIRVQATAVHHVDLLSRAGVTAPVIPADAPRPLVLGWDLAGVVDAVGSEVTEWQPGDHVVGLTRWFDTGRGAYAEYVTFDADWIARAPSNATPEEAAALPLNAQTAVQALDLLGLEAGQTVAVIGAAGALGGYAVELAKVRGLRVVAVAGADDEELLKSLGADVFVPRSDDLVAAVRAAEPDGVDGLLDAAIVGPSAVGAVRDGGAFVAVTAGVDPAPERGIRVATVGVRPNGAELAELVALVEAGKLTLRVADVYPFAKAGEAHARLAKGGVRGRLVLTP
jgi:NADPH:quinone reductase-like Zn-dependent oxidoreductase